MPWVGTQGNQPSSQRNPSRSREVWTGGPACHAPWFSSPRNQPICSPIMTLTWSYCLWSGRTITQEKYFPLWTRLWAIYKEKAQVARLSSPLIPGVSGTFTSTSTLFWPEMCLLKRGSGPLRIVEAGRITSQDELPKSAKIFSSFFVLNGPVDFPCIWLAFTSLVSIFREAQCLPGAAITGWFARCWSAPCHRPSLTPCGRYTTRTRLSHFISMRDARIIQ